jgi:hypothetical protein
MENPMTTGVLGANPELPKDRADPANTRFAIRLGAAALQIGILGDILLRDAEWGANATLWIVLIELFLVSLVWRKRQAMAAHTDWLLITVAVFASFYALRDAEELMAYGTLALLSSLGLLAVALSDADDPEIWAARIRDHLWYAVSVGSSVVLGSFPLVFSEIRLTTLTSSSSRSRFWPAARALLVAIPLVVIFGALFRSADPVFDRIAGSIFNIDLENFFSHAIPIAFMTWIVAGYFWHGLIASRPIISRPTVALPSVGSLEVGIILGALNALFLSFVTVQFRYLFGGEAFMRETVGLTLAQFARRGFFELVAVAALTLPVLLVGRALVREKDARAMRLIRGLALSLVSLLFLIMGSALQRMLLYVNFYGLTTDRLYATVVMGWLALVFVWTVATLLRGNVRRFATGVIVSGWATLVGLAFVNPEAFVVRVNHQRAKDGATFDATYASRLSADAVPSVVDALLTLPAARMVVEPQVSGTRPDLDRCVAAQTLLQRWLAEPNGGWRGWNLSRARARRAVAEHEGALRVMACRRPSSERH